MKKIYGARGMLDWQLALDVKGAIVRICFSGGSMGSNGVIPARYVTENEAIQKIIEESLPYKDGRIILLNETGNDKDKS